MAIIRGSQTADILRVNTHFSEHVKYNVNIDRGRRNMGSRT